MLKIVLVFVCIPALISAKFYKCSSGVPGPEEIFINFCDENDACAVSSDILGKTVQLEIDFLAGASSRTLTSTVNGPWWVFQKESNAIGCNSLSTNDGKLGCPIKAGSFYTYKMEIVVQELDLPLTDMNVDVEIELVGERGKLMCFKVKAFTIFKS